MTDDPNPPAPDPSPEPPQTDAHGEPSVSDAWAEVVVRMGELNDSIGRWAKAAADNPENRRRAAEVRASVSDMAKKADSAFNEVVGSDFGQQVRVGAEQAGAAIGDAASAAAPMVASAFSGLAGVLGRAATRVDEAVHKTGATDAPASETAPDAPTPDAPEPPTPPDRPAS